MKNTKQLRLSAVFALLSIIWMGLVKTVDVAPIGPNETSVGFSGINGAIHDFFGENLFWYNITQVLGIVALLVCVCFGLVGLVQLIKRKSIAKVDRNILCLGGLYIVTIALYALFEKLIINYRPIIMPGETEPEASFPSSHTMLIVVVMCSTLMVIGNYVKNENLVRIIRILCWLIVVLTVVGRLICGVHWFSDIIGGILISATLVSAFAAFKE